MKTAILEAINVLSKLTPDKLKEERYNKFRAMGRFIEA
jgi:acetyl-CoA carboxylase alpha subunit